MRRLWKLSLVVLLLGNAIDGFVTYLNIRQLGIRELNPIVRWGMEHLGLFPVLVPIKIVFGSFAILVMGIFLRVWYVGILGSWVGIRFVTILNLIFGTSLVLAGTGWGREILQIVLPTKINNLINLYLSKGLVGWTIIVAIEVFLLFIFLEFTVLPILRFLDRRRRQDSV